MRTIRRQISDKTLLAIGQMIHDGYRQKAIAEKFGLHRTLISRMATGHHRRYNELIAPPAADAGPTVKQKMEAKILELIDLLGEMK